MEENRAIIRVKFGREFQDLAGEIVHGILMPTLLSKNMI
jgi:hypothetical protein